MKQFTVKESIKTLHRQETSLMQSSIAGILVTLFFSIVDFYTLFDLFDKSFTMAQSATTLLCVSYALILNFTGYCAAYFVRRHQLDKNPWTFRMGIVSVGIFAAAFLTTIFLRVCLFGSGAETINPVTGLAGATVGADSAQFRKELGSTVAMSVSPFLTSFICFMLNMLSDPKRDRQKCIEKNIVCLNETMSAARCSAEALSAYDADKAAAKEDEAYDAFLREIDNHGETMKRQVRQILMQHVGSTPEKVSAISGSTSAEHPQR